MEDENQENVPADTFSDEAPSPSCSIDLDFNPTAHRASFSEPRSPPPKTLPAQPSRRARVEDVDDLTGSTRYINPYPKLAGAAKGRADPKFEQIKKEQYTQGKNPWAPFENQDEWELARWLSQNMGQAQTESYLKLPIVGDHRASG